MSFGDDMTNLNPELCLTCHFNASKLNVFFSGSPLLDNLGDVVNVALNSETHLLSGIIVAFVSKSMRGTNPYLSVKHLKNNNNGSCLTKGSPPVILKIVPFLIMK